MRHYDIFELIIVLNLSYIVMQYGMFDLLHVSRLVCRTYLEQLKEFIYNLKDWVDLRLNKCYDDYKK